MRDFSHKLDRKNIDSKQVIILPYFLDLNSYIVRLIYLHFKFHLNKIICRIYLPQRVYLKDIQTK
jgi:hypothetical protein